MIKFEGEISGQTLKFIINQHRNKSLIAASIVSVILAIGIIIFAILYDTVYFIGLAFPIIFVVLSVFAKPSKSIYNIILPQRVYIEGETIICENEKGSISRTLDQVETVIDFGEGYYIRFYFGYRSNTSICQKSLLIQGSIEEFEKKFDGKIVRKIK